MGGCCDDDCFDDCSWTTIILWVGGALLLGGVIAVLVVVFAIFKPPTATVDDAVLQLLDLSPGTPAANSTISYNITARLTLRNPNIYYGISYDAFTTALSFNNTRFHESSLPALEHKARKKVTLNIKVGGVNKPIKLTDAGVSEFDKEKKAGKFQVELRLDTVLTYKGRGTKCPTGVVCPLQLQLVDPDVAATAFQVTKCTVLRAKKYGC
ncbi:hypothetical protein EJB05_03422, partial [Eragrostis curvula]